jgi:hypothetical protein
MSSDETRAANGVRTWTIDDRGTIAVLGGPLTVVALPDLLDRLEGLASEWEDAGVKISDATYTQCAEELADFIHSLTEGASDA